MAVLTAALEVGEPVIRGIAVDVMDVQLDSQPLQLGHRTAADHAAIPVSFAHCLP